MSDFDLIDGQRVPGTVVTTNKVLAEHHNGSVRVRGCELIITGMLNGSLSVEDGGSVRVVGIHNGSLNVGSDSRALISGRSNGSTNISSSGTVIVENTGRLSGSTNNNGTFIIRGAFGGAYSGQGVRTIEGDGYIKQPVIRDGISYYEW